MRLFNCLLVVGGLVGYGMIASAESTSDVACGMGYSAAPSAYCGFSSLPPEAVPPQAVRPVPRPRHEVRKPVKHRH